MDWSVNLREYFRAELIGRIDAIIPFSALNPEDFRQLLRLSVGSGQSLREGLRLEFRLSEECEEQIVKTLSSPLDGARGFLRRVKSELLVPLGDFIGQLAEGEKRVNIDWREGAVRFSVADL
jgi:ATP-dependent Clp protease ATP-binding subunit ClpA